MLTPAQVQQFQKDGFLRGSKVLSAAQVDELCNEMERILVEFKDGVENAPDPKPVVCRNIARDSSTAVWQIVNIYNASEAFRRLVFNPTITQEIAQLTGASEIRMWHDQIQYKPAGTGGVNMWHQDAPYWPVLTPMKQVTAWVALDDVDTANGCMSMVPGSHLWGDNIAFLHTLKKFEYMPGEFDGHPTRRPGLPGETRRGALPPRPDVARLQRQHLSRPAAGHRPALHARRHPLHRREESRDEAVYHRPRRGSDQGRGVPARVAASSAVGICTFAMRLPCGLRRFGGGGYHGSCKPGWRNWQTR